MHLSDKKAKMLADCIRASHPLRKISFHRCKLRLSHFQMIFEAMATQAGLKELTFHNVNVSRQACGVIADYLQQVPTLKTLKLVEAGIAD